MTNLIIMNAELGAYQSYLSTYEGLLEKVLQSPTPDENAVRAYRNIISKTTDEIVQLKREILRLESISA